MAPMSRPQLGTPYSRTTFAGAHGLAALNARGGAVFLAIFCLAGGSPPAMANPILDWNDLMLDAIRIESTAPTISARHLAMLNIAMFDAVNSVTRTHQAYRFQAPLPAGAETSAEAAATSAAYESFVLLYPSLGAWAVDLYAGFLASNPDSITVSNGLALGRQVAWQAVDARSSDGANTEVPYIPSNAPGAWQRTPPFFRPPLTPHWRLVAPFCLPSIEPFLPPPPPALSSAAYADGLEEVKALGGKTSAVRTPEQTEIAVFWSDFSYTAMPPGHWHEMAIGIARAHGVNFSLDQHARLLALLSLAQADAAIVCWEAKFRHNLWRPITAIRRADEDDNPSTAADPTWDHLLAAPPFPAYTSGHSTFSAAAAATLSAVLGTDAIEFVASSDSLPGVTRRFTSLGACADEVGLSRIYGGIHFPFDNTAGKACGQRIGQFVARNYLLPLATLPRIETERSTAGTISFRVHGRNGATTVLARSGDLQNWSPAATNRSIAGGWRFVSPATSLNGQLADFFRVRESFQ